MRALKAGVRLLRPHQWVKNVFVLAGVFFAAALGDALLLRDVGLAFVAFCLASGATYALNDLLDAEADRRHPRKNRRPIASGDISKPAAAVLAVSSAFAGLAIAALVSWRLLTVLALYGAINVAYSRWLKHAVLVDVFCIASGFVLRLLAGTWGVGVPPSQWFVLCAFLLSLFLGFSKRYAERMDATQDAAHKRAVVEEYSPEFLRTLLAVTLACTLIAYGLYTLNPRTLAMHGGGLIYTLPFVAFSMFRYLYLVMQKGYGENLSGELLRDRWLIVSALAYVALAATLLL